VRRRGSAGGHRGLASVIEHLGTEEFGRVRVGVGAPPSARPRRDYVLSSFRGEEAEAAGAAVERAASAVECWLKGGIERCMNRYNAAPDGQGE
jgi:PTH1 family peptidyl-tRNA hydrolase